jgi:hypothetical protein
MPPEALAEETAGTVARDRPADLPAHREAETVVGEAVRGGDQEKQAAGVP